MLRIGLLTEGKGGGEVKQVLKKIKVNLTFQTMDPEP